MKRVRYSCSENSLPEESIDKGQPLYRGSRRPKRWQWITSLLAIPTLLSGGEIEDRLSCWIQLGEVRTAYEEWLSAADLRHSLPLRWELQLRLLALAGREQQAVSLWRQQANPEDERQLRLLEEVAWIALQRAQQSSNLLLKAHSLIAAATTGDSRSLPLVGEVLEQETHPLLLAVAIQAAGELRDCHLLGLVAKLLSRPESSSLLRSASLRALACQALAASGDRRWLPLLLSLQRPFYSSAEDERQRARAIASLLGEEATPWIEKMSGSPDMGMKLLACEIAAEGAIFSSAPFLWPLIEEPIASLRMAALQALGLLLQAEQITSAQRERVRCRMEDDDLFVALSAAWLYSIIDREEAVASCHSRLETASRSNQPFVIAALDQMGSAATARLQQLWSRREQLSPGCQITLALAMLKRDVDTHQATELIAGHLLDQSQRFCCLRKGLFRTFLPQIGLSSKRQADEEDARARLDLIQRLAVAKSCRAVELLQQMMRRQLWGVSGSAALLLLEEGWHEAASLIQEQLQKASTRSIQLQAVLALALSEGSRSTTLPLLQLYGGAQRQEREAILAAIGKVADLRALPLLLEVMETEAPSMRLSAACALLQLLYR